MQNVVYLFNYDSLLFKMTKVKMQLGYMWMFKKINNTFKNAKEHLLQRAQKPKKGD